MGGSSVGTAREHLAMLGFDLCASGGCRGSTVGGPVAFPCDGSARVRTAAVVGASLGALIAPGVAAQGSAIQEMEPLTPATEPLTPATEPLAAATEPLRRRASASCVSSAKEYSTAA